MRFTSRDKEIVRVGLNFLTSSERQILIFRFWENMTIAEIAEVLGMKWEEVNKTLEVALESLKTFCLTQMDFSVHLFKEAA